MSTKSFTCIIVIMSLMKIPLSTVP